MRWLTFRTSHAKLLYPPSHAANYHLTIIPDFEIARTNINSKNALAVMLVKIYKELETMKDDHFRYCFEPVKRD